MAMIIEQLLPGHLPMVPIAGVGGFHRAQHVAFDTWRSFQAKVAGTPKAGRLQDVTRPADGNPLGPTGTMERNGESSDMKNMLMFCSSIN